MTWLQMWVELETPQQVADYRRFLHDYAAQEHASGRFQRGPDTARLYPLMDWLGHKKLVPSEVQLQLWLAIGFLIVCLVNIVALLLAKFLRRGGEVGVRRALGARASDILLQLGCEAALIGVAGGCTGKRSGSARPVERAPAPGRLCPDRADGYQHAGWPRWRWPSSPRCWPA